MQDTGPPGPSLDSPGIDKDISKVWNDLKASK